MDSRQKSTNTNRQGTGRSSHIWCKRPDGATLITWYHGPEGSRWHGTLQFQILSLSLIWAPHQLSREWQPSRQQTTRPQSIWSLRPCTSFYGFIIVCCPCRMWLKKSSSTRRLLTATTNLSTRWRKQKMLNRMSESTYTLYTAVAAYIIVMIMCHLCLFARSWRRFFSGGALINFSSLDTHYSANVFTLAPYSARLRHISILTVKCPCNVFFCVIVSL